MRHGFVAYAKAKPHILEMSNEEIIEEMRILACKAKEYDIDMHMWGFPYGVDDDLLIVFESQKGLENYMNFEISTDLPYSNTRTTIVAIPLS